MDFLFIFEQVIDKPEILLIEGRLVLLVQFQPPRWIRTRNALLRIIKSPSNGPLDAYTTFAIRAAIIEDTAISDGTTLLAVIYNFHNGIHNNEPHIVSFHFLTLHGELVV